jgi:hypothetical protein
MLGTALRAVFLLLTAGLLLPASGMAEQEAEGDEKRDYVVWLNDVFADATVATKATLGRRSVSNQVESSALTGNSTALLDRSSATDLLGLALDLADLSGTGNAGRETNSGSFTTTAYAFRTLLSGTDPLAPDSYCRLARWRRFSVNLAFEGEEFVLGLSDSATTFGAKVVWWDGRDPCGRRYDTGFSELTSLLAKASSEAGDVHDDVRRILFERLRGSGDAAAKIAFMNEIANAPDFETWLLAQPNGAELLEEVRQQALSGAHNAAGMKELRAESQKLFETIRGAVQSSASFVTKQRDKGADEYDFNLIVDCSTQCGLSDRIDFAANGGFKYIDSSIGANQWGGSAALELRVRMNPSPNFLQGRNYEIVVAGRGDWAQDRSGIYKVQGKMAIPIVSGFELPLSVTWANRTELINESEVRGQIGFSVDTSRLASLFTGSQSLGALARASGM